MVTQFPVHKQFRSQSLLHREMLTSFYACIREVSISKLCRLTGYPYWGGVSWFSSVSPEECPSNRPKLIPFKFKNIRQAVYIPISLDAVKPTQLKQHLNERVKQCTMYKQLTNHSITKLVVDLIQWYSTNVSRLKEGRKWHSEGSLTFCKNNWLFTN
jgi:hypothetical protein